MRPCPGGARRQRAAERSVYGGACVPDRLREGEGSYQVRKRLLKLKVSLVCQGAHGVAVDFSPELNLATVVLLEVGGDVVDH